MISTYTELLDEIGKLEAPPRGRVRVFRGQTQDFPLMIPSGMRRQIRNEAVWHYYAMALARDLIEVRDDKPRLSDATMATFWDKEAVWINAVAQHYGPGSNFLDVTRCLHVALWFALHQAASIRADHTLGPPGPGDPAQDIVHTEFWTRYSKWDAGPGFLYFFDVPEFDMEGSPPHGSLLDLSKAHPIFSESRRIKAQAACLIAADRAVHLGDLRSFLAGDPIKVHWPMEGAPRLDSPIEGMFPDPSQDEWYERFVTMPLTYEVNPASSSLSLARPIEITLYHYDSRDRIEEVLRRIKYIPTTRPRLSDSLTMGLVEPESMATSHLSDATRILLDTPIMSRLPDAGSQMWNHGILAGDMSDSVEAFDLPNDAPGGSVSLTNVYFELCPLEVTGWEQLGKPDGKIEWLGGMWIVRKGELFAVQLFPSWLENSNEFRTVTQGLRYDYRVADGKFWRRSAIKEHWTAVVGDKPVDKAFFTSLAVLRFLSPAKKADPFPLEKLSGDRIRALTIPVRSAVARLMRVLEKNSDRHWYVPRDILSREGFFLEPTAYLGTLSLESDALWSSIDATGIRRDIAEQCGTT